MLHVVRESIFVVLVFIDGRALFFFGIWIPVARTHGCCINPTIISESSVNVQMITRMRLMRRRKTHVAFIENICQELVALAGDVSNDENGPAKQTRGSKRALVWTQSKTPAALISPSRYKPTPDAKDAVKKALDNETYSIPDFGNSKHMFLEIKKQSSTSKGHQQIFCPFHKYIQADTVEAIKKKQVAFVCTECVQCSFCIDCWRKFYYPAEHDGILARVGIPFTPALRVKEWARAFRDVLIKVNLTKKHIGTTHVLRYGVVNYHRVLI